MRAADYDLPAAALEMENEAPMWGNQEVTGVEGYAQRDCIGYAKLRAHTCKKHKKAHRCFAAFRKSSANAMDRGLGIAPAGSDARYDTCRYRLPKS